jgi:Outer membrane protein beta-barrel domain
MKKLVLVLSLFLAAPAFAQSVTPQWELFGGATWLRADISPALAPIGLAHVSGMGWDGSLTENVNGWFGMTLDVSGAYARPSIRIPANLFGPGLPPAALTFSNEVNGKAYTYMFGPTFAYRRSERFVPFGRVLLGAATARAETTSKGAATLAFLGIIVPPKPSDTRFALMGGGGVDVTLSPLIAVRGTFDLLHTTFRDFGDDRQNSIRISGGIVFRFGSKP